MSLTPMQEEIVYQCIPGSEIFFPKVLVKSNAQMCGVWKVPETLKQSFNACSIVAALGAKISTHIAEPVQRGVCSTTRPASGKHLGEIDDPPFMVWIRTSVSIPAILGCEASVFPKMVVPLRPVPPIKIRSINFFVRLS